MALSLGSNGVDWVRSLWKHPTRLRGMNFWINCTTSTHFAPSFMQLLTIPNAPKHYEMHQNMTLGSNDVDWVRSLRKIPMWIHGTSFCINCTSSPRFAPSLIISYETIPNAPKHCKTHQNMGLGSNGLDWVRSSQKILTRLLGTKFCINCTSSDHFAPSFMQ